MRHKSFDTPAVAARAIVVRPSAGEERASNGRRLAVVSLLCVILSAAANHVLGHWLGISRGAPWTTATAAYRRIGPPTGPQVFCAGSSLLVSGLSWLEVSQSLGQGIENWTVAGSSPEVWEVFQRQKRVCNTTIIGVSVYDLNEMRLTPDRASFVSLGTTLRDLWSSQTDPDLKYRILAQYAMSYVRLLYPVAGDADKVLVGLRAKAADLLCQQASLEEHEGVVVEKAGVLDVQDAATSLGGWPSARVLRRSEALQAENHGAHVFGNGPKARALQRVLSRASQQGVVIVVVLPVSQYYTDALMNRASVAAFERALADAMAAVPQATLVRLDHVPAISDNRKFLDLVHLNSSGRRIATRAFLKEVNRDRTAALTYLHSEPPPGEP